jgi:3-oxoacyl-[acyl-carrier-protein] synthase III
LSGGTSQATVAGIGVALAGWGMAVPDRRVTNHDLALRVDTSDAWIVDRTGIRERRWVVEGESTATLAIEAGAAAVKQADLSPSDIGCCVVCTCTPEQPIPPTASFVQDALGLRCGAFDIDAACSGFVYGLVMAASMVAAAGLGPVLLIGSETLSRFADPEDRSTCVLFGDGAGAVVLVPSDQPALLAWDLASDGSAASLLAIPAGGSRLPASPATLAARDHFLKMDGKEVFRRAVRAMVGSGEITMEKAGVGPDDLALWIPHQANARIIDATASRLGVPPEKVFVNVDRYGNTSAASVPICLAEAAEEGRLADGDLVMVSGVGAGMSWATALIRWGTGGQGS